MTKTKHTKQKDHNGLVTIKKLFLLLLISVFSFGSSFANVATSYFFSQSIGSPYTYIGNQGTVLIPTAGVLDDQSFTDQPIGFTFKYDGVNYSTFGVNVNGYLKLGSGVVPNDDNQVLAGTTNTLSALNIDLEAQDVGAEIRYFVNGIAPNRTLIVQWYRMSVKPEFPYNNTNLIDFQIVLQETSNIIQFKYGAVQGGSNHVSTSAQVGISGGVTSDFLIRKDGISPNQWSNSVKATSNNTEMTLTSSIRPPTDLVYTFTPNVPCAAIIATPVVTNPCSVTLNWSAPDASVSCALPDNYKLYVSKNNLFVDSTNIVNGTTQVATTYTLLNILPNTTYYWKVIPKNSFGEGSFTVNNFTTVNKIPNLVLTPKVNDTAMFTNVVNTPTVKLSWTAPAVACGFGLPTSYKVYLDTTLIATVDASIKSVTTGSLKLNTTYNWYVDAINSAGTTRTAFSFKTRNLVPDAVTLSSPANGVYMVSQTPIFTWLAPTITPYFGEAINYVLKYGQNPTLPDSTTTIVPLGNVLTYTSTTLPLNTKYYWKVVAKNAIGSGIFSPTWSFTTTPGTGTLKGLVLHLSSGIVGATVTAAPSNPGYTTVTTTSTVGGQYQFNGVYDTITYTISAKHPEYNDSPSYVISVIKGGTTVKDIVMTRPVISVLPTTNFIVNVRPNACKYTNLSHYFTVQNLGNGVLTWNHEITTTQNWLKLTNGTQFTLQPSTNVYDSTYFTTIGLTDGTQKTATVKFTSVNPNVGGFTVPVIMNVTGNEIISATNLTTTLNGGTGIAILGWNGPNTGYEGFLNFKVLRNGTTLVSVAPVYANGKWTLTETLPMPPTTTPVTTFYTVEAIYGGGYTSCVGTSPSVTYYRPVALVQPLTITKTLLPNKAVISNFEVINNGDLNSILAINSITAGSFIEAPANLPTYINGQFGKTFDAFFNSHDKLAGTYTQAITIGTNVNSLTVSCVMNVLAVYPPTNLVLTTTGTPEMSIKLTWSAPVGVNSLKWYNVYRSAGYAPTGENVDTYNWTLVADSVTNLFWTDKDLSNLVNNTYSYRLTAVYDEGESDPTGIVHTQLFLNTNPTVSTEKFSMYPNPTNSNKNVEMKLDKVKNFYVYNTNGKIVGKQDVKGKTDFILNTRDYPAGSYIVKFYKENGETFYSKLVVIK